MARYEFNSPSGLDTLAQYRVDTASGSSSAATIQLSNTFADIPGALLRTDENGKLPDFIGSAATLYAKRVQPGGATSGSPTTMTGILLDQSSGGGGGTVAYGTTAGTAAEGNDSRITGAAQKSANLSDLASASTARTSLGLGGAATLAVGTGAGTVAAGDDSRITGAAQKASNLSDVASASTSRTNLGLGSAATMTPASLAADSTFTTTYARATVWPRNAVDAGLVGDDSTDNTVVAQAWITDLVTKGREGYIPSRSDGTPAVYRISSALNFSQRPGWALKGAGGRAATWKQTTDNVPIFNLCSDTASFMHSFKIEGMGFDYLNTQPAANTAANPLYFNQMAFEGSIRDLVFSKGSYAIRTASSVDAPWGITWDDLQFGGGLTAGAMDWSNATAGTPNNKFGRMLVSCDNMVGPVFRLRGYNFVIETLEFLAATYGPQLMELAAGGEVEIGTMKLEQGVYTSSKALFEFQASSHVKIGHFSIGGSAMNVSPASGSVRIFQIGVGGGEGNLEIGHIRAQATTQSGTAVAVSGSSPSRIRVGKLDLQNGWKLQDNGSSASGEIITVDAHANGRLSTDKGDANYTVALGDPTMIRFETAFTAQRTVTLPADGDNLFNGLTYEIACSGAINGSNTLLVKAGATTLRTQTADGVVLKYTWRRNATAASGWKLTTYDATGESPAIKTGSTADVVARELVVPEGGLFAASSAATWYTANSATFMRFHVPFRKAYRWINLRIGTQSGNIQVGVSSLSRSGTTVTATRVMDSGVISCPAAGGARIDCGTVTLPPGDYAMYLWCDNTTAQFLHGLATGIDATRLLFAATGLSSGVTGSAVTLSPTGRWVSGMTLESDS